MTSCTEYAVTAKPEYEIRSIFLKYKNDLLRFKFARMFLNFSIITVRTGHSSRIWS